MPGTVRGAVLAALLLAGCAEARQFETGVIEPKVDAAYDELLARWCNMPPDIHVRAIGRRTVTPRSLTDNCAAWRALRDALLGEAAERAGR